MLRDPAFETIARAAGKTSAQVVLRWHIQRGDIVLPKSETESRVRENREIFDFELDQASMATITRPGPGEKGRTGGNPDTMDRVPKD